MEDLLTYLHFVLLPQAIDGLIIGVALVLVALGLTLIFGLLDVINLAHGELYMLGGYAALTLALASVGYWGALLLAPALVGLVGVGLERFGISRLMGRKDRAILTLLLTFGISLLLRDLAQVVWGVETYAVEAPVEGVLSIGGLFIPKYRLVILVVGVLLITFTWWLIYRTGIGAILRAAAADPQMVASLGVPIRWVYSGTFFYGCALAGVSGVLLSPIYAVFPMMGHDFLVLAFAVVIVGGMGSIAGAVVAGLFLSELQSLSSLWIAPVWAETLVYGTMVLVLIVRPGGLWPRIGEA